VMMGTRSGYSFGDGPAARNAASSTDCVPV
jgi:hypothetical protein